MASNKETVSGFLILIPPLFLLSLLLLLFPSPANGDLSQDIQECGQALTGLATCLPYVTDKANAPTPDCCSGLKQLLKTDKKCLCVVIEDRNDPQLGLTINVTSALLLPTLCNSPANVSKCPELLHLDPKSEEAKVFYQLGKAADGSVSAPGIAPATAPAPTAGNSTTKSKDANGVERHGGRLQVLFGGILLFFVI